MNGAENCKNLLFPDLLALPDRCDPSPFLICSDEVAAVVEAGLYSYIV